MVDSVAVSHIHSALEHGRLPWPVLIALLVCMFGVLAFAIAKFAEVLRILNGPPPFPTHATTTLVGLLPFLGITTVAICRAALGMEWPDGYDFVLGSIVSVILGVAAWGVGKRLTDERYVAAKAGAQSPSVNVEGDAMINTTAEHPAVPKAGVVPRNPDVKIPIENYAQRQQAAIANPGEPSD